MKTLEFKLYLKPYQEEKLNEWLEILRWVWNEGLGILEWCQHYQRMEKCIGDANTDEAWGFDKDSHPVVIRAKKIIGEDKKPLWVYCCDMAQDFRLDRSKGWEVPGNTEFRQCIPLVRREWMEAPPIPKINPNELKKQFAKMRCPKLQESDIPSSIVNDFIRLVLWPAWEQYAKGVRRKPLYKKEGEIRTISSDSFASSCEVGRSGDRLQKIRIPVLKWIKAKGLHERLPADPEIPAYRICKKASGWYLQLVVKNIESRFPRAYKKGFIDIDETDSDVLYSTHEREQRASLKLEEYGKELAKLQRHLTKLTKGSYRYRQTRVKIAKLHEKIARSRRAHHHWHSTFLTDLFGEAGVTIAPIGVKPVPNPIFDKQKGRYLFNGRTSTRQINKRVLDKSPGQFRTLLVQKISTAGGTVIIDKLEDETPPPKPKRAKKKPAADGEVRYVKGNRKVNKERKKKEIAI